MSAGPESRIEDIVPLTHDTHLFRYVAAWHRVPRDASGQPDLEHAARMLGLNLAAVSLLHERAQSFALVRSDGTLSDHAAQYVRARLAGEIGGPKRGAKK